MTPIITIDTVSQSHYAPEPDVYHLFSSLPKLQPLVAEISWSNNLIIMGESAPIGIIICRDKNKTVVEYALRTASRPIGVATYSIVPELPEAYRDKLPSPEAIAERLQAWSDLEENNE